MPKEGHYIHRRTACARRAGGQMMESCQSPAFWSAVTRQGWRRAYRPNGFAGLTAELVMAAGEYVSVSAQGRCGGR